MKTLYAVQQFAKGQYQTAIETFLVFNVNPALVIAMFPSNSISGKSYVPKDRWMELFGAVEGAKLEPEDNGTLKEEAHRGLLKRVTNMSLSKKGSMDTLRTSLTHGPEQSDTASISNERVSSPPVIDESKLSLASLLAGADYSCHSSSSVGGAHVLLIRPTTEVDRRHIITV